MAKISIVKASTNVTVNVFVQDSSSTTGAGLTGLVFNTASLVCYYVRPLAAAAALTLATQTVTGAHSDGGFVEIDATNMPGWYRLDLSDAIVATGVDHVGVHLKGAANMAPLPLEIQLTTFDLNDASPLVTLASETHTGAVIPTVTTLTGHTAQTGDTYALANGAAGFVAIDTVVDGIQTDLSNGTDGLGAIKGDTAAILIDTADIQPKLGTPAADLSADIAAVKVDTAAVLVDTGTTLDTKLNDIQGATFSSVTDSLEAIRDRGDAAWTTGAGGSDRLLLVDTTIATLSSQTSFTLTAGSADNDAYNNCTIVIEDVATSTQKALGIVSDYVGSTKTVTLLNDPAIFTMAATDKIYILAENALKATGINRQLDVTATGAAGIDWANIENPTTAVDLSGTDIQLADTVTTLTGHTAQTGDTYALANGAAGFTAIDTVVDGIQTDLSNGTDGLGAIKAETALIVADTNELQTDWVNGGRLDLLIDAIKLVTDALPNGGALTNLDAAISTVATPAQVNVEVSDVLKTDTITEVTQQAPPASPTFEEALMYLYMVLRNKIDITSSTKEFHNDAGTVIWKKALTDDATTYSEAEGVTGP